MFITLSSPFLEFCADHINSRPPDQFCFWYATYSHYILQFALRLGNTVDTCLRETAAESQNLVLSAFLIIRLRGLFLHRAHRMWPIENCSLRGDRSILRHIWPLICMILSITWDHFHWSFLFVFTDRWRSLLTRQLSHCGGHLAAPVKHRSGSLLVEAMKSGLKWTNVR